MRLAEARLAASIMIHCSMSESLTDRPGVRQWDWMMKTSAPRTDSANRGRISPLAKSTRLASPSSTPEVGGDLLGERRVGAAGEQVQLARRYQFHRAVLSLGRQSLTIAPVKHGPVTCPAATRVPGGR